MENCTKCILLIIISTFLCLESEAQGRKYYKKKQFVISEENEKYGCIDSNGKIIVPYKYDWVYSVSDSFFIVGNRIKSKNEKNGYYDRNNYLYGLYTNRGKCIYKPQFIGLNVIPDKKLILRTTKFLGTRYYSGVSYKKRIVVTPKRSPILVPHPSQFSIIRARKKCYILKNYTLIQVYGNFDDIRKVEQAGRENLKYVIKKKGIKKYRWVEKGIGSKVKIYKINHIEQYMVIDTSGVAIAKNGNVFGLINKDGKIIDNIYYDEIGIFYGNNAKVKKDDKYGLIDMSGTLITKLNYKDIIRPVFSGMGGPYYCYFENRATKVKTDNGWGFINYKGQEIGTMDYDSVSGFEDNGYALIMKNGKWGIIDYEGKEVLPVIYDAIHFVKACPSDSPDMDGGPTPSSKKRFAITIDKKTKIIYQNGEDAKDKDECRER